MNKLERDIKNIACFRINARKQKLKNYKSDLEQKIEEIDSELSILRLEKPADAEEVVKNLKSLRFVENISYENGKLEILTEDLLAKGKYFKYNLGAYLIIFPEFRESPLMRIKRINGPIGSGRSIDHPFVKYQKICFGTSETRSLFSSLMEEGRVDQAIPLVWAVLSYELSGYDTPYMSLASFSIRAKKRDMKNGIKNTLKKIKIRK